MGLEREFDDEEVLEALGGLAADKALGLDGFTIAFGLQN